MAMVPSDAKLATSRVGGIAMEKQGESSCRFLWSNAAFRESNPDGASSSWGFSSEDTPCPQGQELGASETIVWMNAVYCWEVNSAGSSSGGSSGVKPLIRRFGDAVTSGSDSIPGFTVFRTPEGCIGESVGSASGLKSALGSTRKRLIEFPEFREEEGWVHGPQRNMEQELASEMAVDRLEAETEQRLEEELERDIQALSRKLASLHAQHPNNGEKDRSKLSSRNQQAKNSKSSKLEGLQEPLHLHDFKKLASSLWRKRPDWVTSLRRTEAVQGAPPKAAAGTAARTILKERNVAPVRRQPSSKSGAKENRAGNARTVTR